MGRDPLTIGVIFERMRTVHGDACVSDPEGSRTYREVGERVLRLVTVLRELGVGPGDRVATFAVNTTRHLELYFAVPLAGAVLHTVNTRLHPDQIRFVLDAADDRLVFADPDLLDRLPASAERSVVTLDGDYEARLAAAAPATELAEVGEDDACGMCHTSGTTGQPKAVVYSHRSTVLHAMAACMVDHLALGQRDVVLPVVPLFHACGWGLPYAAPFTGADLVLPGADTSPGHLGRVIANHGVTFAAGVPTIWTQLLPLAQAGAVDLSSLRTIGIGGSATPLALLEAYDELGVEVLQIWGMTETSPLACTSRPRRRHRGLGDAELRAVRAKTGTIWAGLSARIVSAEGDELPWDGVAVGELECRGPWVATAYHDDPGLGDRFHDGWLRTGDLAVMEPDGVFTIVDRAKDLVKSGGEWISSVELEGHVLAHPGVREAAVVGVRSERWDERPVVVVAPADPAVGAPSLADLREFLADRVPRWWLPDDVVEVAEVAKTSVGKLDKKALRAALADRVLP